MYTDIGVLLALELSRSTSTKSSTTPEKTRTALAKMAGVSKGIMTRYVTCHGAGEPGHEVRSRIGDQQRDQRGQGHIDERPTDDRADEGRRPGNVVPRRGEVRGAPAH